MSYAYRAECLREAAARGFLLDLTEPEAADAWFCAGPVAVYIGFDCTAPSLHAGSLLQLMLLRLLQRHGHRPIVLLGGGTTQIGDPSGKDEARKLLDAAAIAENLRGIGAVIATFCGEVTIVNNANWLAPLNYIEFLRDYGRHFSVNRMLGFDSVRLRLERQQPLSFLEFNYMLLQAYDFLELYRRTGCRVQAGGSDQRGNIVNGIDLVRRCEGQSVFGLTTPLITTADGGKMGKTAEGAVWLTADRCDPWAYRQYWRNTADADVGRFLRLFTELPLHEIARYDALQGAELNAAKEVLADAAVTLAHGAAAAAAASARARASFGDADSDAVPELPLLPGDTWVDVLERGALAESRSEARRLLRGGGVKLNDAPVDETTDVAPGILRVGKKKIVRLRPPG